MFTNNKAKLAYDPETGQLGTARTEGTISYLNANELLSSDIGKQLHIATVLSHESARDGRDSPNQQSETRESVRAHWLSEPPNPLQGVGGSETKLALLDPFRYNIQHKFKSERIRSSL